MKRAHVKKTTICIRLRDDVLRWVEAQAKIGGISRSQYIESALSFGAEFTPKVLDGLATLMQGLKEKDKKALGVVSKE